MRQRRRIGEIVHATMSMDALLILAARKKSLPIRPKPLIATFIVTSHFLRVLKSAWPARH